MTVTPLIFLDTETTGLRPDIHAPWEVAWITAHEDNDQIVVLERHTWFVDLDGENVEVDPFALKVGRYDERYDDGISITPTDLTEKLIGSVHQLQSVTGHEKPILVGAVPSFDHAMLTRWLGWPGFGEGLWHYHLVDVETLIAGAERIAPPWKYPDLLARVGIIESEDEKHTALGDVEVAMRAYAAVRALRITRTIERIHHG